METQWLIDVIIFIGLIIATITDIKKREVPDTLNFGLIILGIVIGIVGSIFSSSFTPLISSAIGLLTGYLVGALMFYTGQWGGGDAKMLMGMGSIIGISWIGLKQFIIGNGEIPYFITTVITIFIAGGLYGFVYTLVLIIKNFKEFKIEFRKRREEKKAILIRKIILGTSFITIIGILISNDPLIKLSLGLIGIFIFFGQYMIIMSKVVEQVCMIKTIPVRALTEGDWIVEDIIIKGKQICGPKDLGISLNQIAKLKKNKIKTIKIKEGIPFIPGFLLGYILMVLFGNWLTLFF